MTTAEFVLRMFFSIKVIVFLRFSIGFNGEKGGPHRFDLRADHRECTLRVQEKNVEFHEIITYSLLHAILDENCPTYNISLQK